MTGSPAVMLGTPASPLDIPLRPAASPSASPLHCGVLSGRLLCPCSPNHQHVPQTSSIIGNPLGLRQHSFFQRTKCSVLFLCKGRISSPIICPIGSQACRKSKISFSFSWSPLFIGYVSSWLWLLFKRAGKQRQGKQCHSLNSSKMLTTHPKSSQLAPQSSWDSTFQHQPAPLQIEVGPLQPRNEPDLVKG